IEGPPSFPRRSKAEPLESSARTDSRRTAVGGRRAMKEPIRTEVDGIPLLWVEDEKPLKAALMFRVGRADETLRTCGITHIVEHLAASTVGKRPHPYNAFVDGTRTVFWTAGRADEVGRFLADICNALSAPPLERLG